MYLKLSCALTVVALVMQNPLYSLDAIVFGICALLFFSKKMITNNHII